MNSNDGKNEDFSNDVKSPEVTPLPPTRSHERFMVHLAVRFRDADTFVQQYAHNLSRGGLFVAGGHTLPRGDELALEIELPGFGTHEVRCRVAHILDEEEAAGRKTPPGAGLELVDTPPDFKRDLLRYLQLLGARKDWRILVHEELSAERLASAGYRAETTAVDGALAVIAAAPDVLAIVIPETDSPPLLRILPRELHTLPLTVGAGVTMDDLLNGLDRRAQARPSPLSPGGASGTFRRPTSVA